MTINEFDNHSYNEKIYKQDNFHCCCQLTPNEYDELESSKISESEVLFEVRPQTDGIADYFWINCENYEPYENYKDGTIIFPAKDNSINSGFQMRSVEEMKKDENIVEFLTFYLNEKNKLVNSSEIKIEDLVKTKEVKRFLKDIDAYYDAEIADNYSCSGEKNKIAHEVGNPMVTIENFVYTTCPPNWTPYAKRVEGHPLLQITENADIRFSEHFSMIADDSGIKITIPPEENDGAAIKKKKKPEEIKFSYKQLKKLLEIVDREIQKENKEAKRK